LNAAVAAGTLSRDQETARLARVRAKVVREVDRTRSRAARTPALAAAARYLGISHARLRSELRSGRTLAQIAAATPGRSTGGLIDAIVAQRRARIEAAASAGRISRSREASSLAGLRRRVTAAVERSPSASERAGPSSGGSAGEAGEPGEGAERGEAPEGEPGEAPEAEAGAEGSGARER
jgi:hypothetical protein